MKKIKGIKRLEESVLRLGGVGDDWHMTWADNDKQYVSLCDGRGFPGMPHFDEEGFEYNARAYAVTGHPPDVTFEFLPGYPDLINTGGTGSRRYYGFGILALDNCIYHFLCTPNRTFSEPESRFVGVKLIYSPDHGVTWLNQDGSTPVVWEPWEERNTGNMLFFNEPDEAFSLITVLQMGKNYEHNRDGFVYLFAPNGNTDGTMNQLVVCRIPKDRILDRGSYEYFVSRRPDGTAEWSPRIEDRGVVHTFPTGWVNKELHPWAWVSGVVYNAPLGLYLMTNSGNGCAADGGWFGKPSYLGFWTAPEPWGPWTQVSEEDAWCPADDSDARAYSPQIPPKWMAGDGTSFWFNWSDFQGVDGDRPYYAFNLQKVEVRVD